VDEGTGQGIGAQPGSQCAGPHSACEINKGSVPELGDEGQILRGVS
jgi:hypothetical protein